MNKQELKFEYGIRLIADDTIIKAESIDTIYSPFFNENVFIILNPESDPNRFLNQLVTVTIWINGSEITEYLVIKAIEKFNNGCVLRYTRHDCDYEENLCSFAKDLYLYKDPKQKIWKGFNTLQKMQYLATMLATVSWKRLIYPKEIILDGNEIDGLYDFYCELGFLLNFNQWGYFGWNLNALDDCLRDLPKDTTIIWKNYNRSRMLIDTNSNSATGAEICVYSSSGKSHADYMCEILSEYINFERID